MLQLTFAMIKPHLTSNPVALKTLHHLILTSNFKVARSKMKTLSLPEASTFYSEHRHKFFYNRLITSITSGPCHLLVLAREDAIVEWRALMGPTKVFRAQFEAPVSLRGTFGLSDTRNATHGSDSTESAKREASMFFPGFEFERWYEEEEPGFRDGNVRFSRREFVHKLKG